MIVKTNAILESKIVCDYCDGEIGDCPNCCREIEEDDNIVCDFPNKKHYHKLCYKGK